MDWIRDFSQGCYTDLALHKETPSHFKAKLDQNTSLG